MSFLYEDMEVLRRFGQFGKMPEFIPENLNPDFELRPYQIAAFENYITWFESDNRPQDVYKRQPKILRTVDSQLW